MATTFKSTKTELVAIYRLEFYKNKKNWKLCHDIKKPLTRPGSPKTCPNLNKTYDVGIEVNKEQESIHNKAFLLEQPDDTPDIQPPSELEDSEDQPPEGQLYDHSWSEQLWTEDKSGFWQDDQQEWCGAEAEGVPEEIAYADECDGHYHPSHNVWTSVNQYEPVKAPCDLEQQLEYLSPAELLQTAEEWLQNHYECGDHCDNYYDQFMMVDNDSTEFVRGAHQAPHSSETDLNISHDECQCGPGRLCWLTSRQLSSSIRKHATALRHLLIEQTLRDKLYCQPHVAAPPPCEERPTRDTDPLLAPDRCVAGSHLRGAGGRGRGRLAQRDGLIGIGMGRPYRL